MPSSSARLHTFFVPVALALFLVAVAGAVVADVFGLSSTPATPSPLVQSYEHGNVTTLDIRQLTENIDADDTGVLNHWLLSNPGRRVTSFTVIPGWRGENVEGYLLQWSAGSNAHEQFVALPLPKYDPDSSKQPSYTSDGWGGSEITAWITAHPGDTVVAIAGVPDQGELQAIRMLVTTS